MRSGHLRYAHCPDGVDAPYLFSAALEDDYLQGFSLKKILKKIVPKPLQNLGKSIEKDFHKAKKWAQDHRKTLQIAAAVIGTAGVAAYAAGGWAALGSKVAMGAQSLWSGLGTAVTSKTAAALGTTALTSAAKLYSAKIQAEAAAAGQQAQAPVQALQPIPELPGGQGMPSGDFGGSGGPMGLPGVAAPDSVPLEPGADGTPQATVEVTAPAPDEGPNWLLIGGVALGLYWLLS